MSTFHASLRPSHAPKTRTENVMSKQHNNTSVYTQQREFRKEEGLLYNRLSSIVEDSDYITYISGLFRGYPLVANLRCGLWYAPKFDNSCYFKSTDGHTHHWTFSRNRLNLHIAMLAATHGGCLIVDSTRKGKKFPDSFSRTIPIWCATVNRAVAILRSRNNTTTTTTTTTNTNTNEVLDTQNVNNQNTNNNNNNNCTNNQPTNTVPTNNEPNYDDNGDYYEECTWDEELHVPLWVSKTEKLQMEALVDNFVKTLLESGADLSPLVNSLQKPLRSIWICPSSLIIEGMMPDRSKLPFASIVCVSASRVQDVIYFADLQTSKYRYVQGAGDDEEGWARGLKPDLFWKNLDFLLEEGPHGIEDRVRTVLKEIEEVQCVTLRNERSSKNLPYTLIGNTGLAVSTATECPNWYDVIEASPNPVFVNCSPLPYRVQGSQSLLTDGPFYKHVPVNHKKAGKIALGHALHALVPFICEKIALGRKEKEVQKRSIVIVHSYESSEVPVCVCLAVLAKMFDFEGENLLERKVVTKEDMAKFYLLVDKYLTLSLPQRTLRNVVNDYLMGPPLNMRDPPVRKTRTKKKHTEEEEEEEEVLDN